MDWRYLDRVEGIAIDSEGTSAHHQLISLDLDQNVLQYTVFYEPFESKKKRHISDSFIDDMNIETPCSYDEKHKLTSIYTDFLKTIRPHGSSTGFQMRDMAKALTFDIAFNRNFEATGMSYRPTLGYMIRKMTFKEAAAEMFVNEELKIIHEIARKSSSTKKYSQKKEISYEEVVSRVGGYVRESKLLIDFSENMDCVFRNDNQPIYSPRELKKIQKMSIHEWADRFNRYHSVSKHLSDSSNLVIPDKAVIPTTASRVDTDHYNIMLTAETLVKGRSPFPKGTTEAVANYKKHQMAWQRLGMV